jgi:hypothetical protein
MKENFIFTGPYLCPNKFCGAQYSLRLLSQVHTTHGSHIIDVIISSVTTTQFKSNRDKQGLARLTKLKNQVIFKILEEK